MRKGTGKEEIMAGGSAGEELLRLGTNLGRHQAFGLVANRCMARHSTVGYCARNSEGTFFAASPIISRLRTTARRSVSSATKSSNFKPVLWEIR